MSEAQLFALSCESSLAHLLYNDGHAQGRNTVAKELVMETIKAAAKARATQERSKGGRTGNGKDDGDTVKSLAISNSMKVWNCRR